MKNILIGQEGGVLEQTAEFFFGRVVMRACAAIGIAGHLVIHREPFQSHDADVFLAEFPDLALLEFHFDFRRLAAPSGVWRASNEDWNCVLLQMGE
jgi:hypothetical protein